mgnify:CR=1 FL=1
MYIYDDFVVNTTEQGNFKVEMYSDDLNTKTTVRISRKEIEAYESSNVDSEMIAIFVAIIRLMRMDSFKVNKDEFEGFVKDITLSRDFKTKFLHLLRTCSIEYLIEMIKDMKYSEMVYMFDLEISELIQYLNI